MLIPTTKEELKKLGWKKPDIILITGDAYIDSPYLGAAIIGRILLKAGYKVGIIGQPDINSDRDISRLGEPALFWGVTGGAIDSMAANYTATKKFRQKDDMTPGGINNRRPDRAVLKYCNLIRRFFKDTPPIVLGGIEASLRRITHYDFWDNKIRNSILFDAKADILVYGMGEKTVLTLAERLKTGEPWQDIRGICYKSAEPVNDYLTLPGAEKVKKDKPLFSRTFQDFYNNTDPFLAKGLNQQHGARWLIQNPPAVYETTEELDAVYNMDYTYEAHPFYLKQGPIKALETIKHSITTHRGCYGECNFCAIALHQGRGIRSRSEKSILDEAVKITKQKNFKGIIFDVGGPTANMYKTGCEKMRTKGSCRNRRCLFPSMCPNLERDHKPQLALLKKLSALKGVKKIFIASGIRHDLILGDSKSGEAYLKKIITSHISGQLKIAPEHISPEILTLMGKPGKESLLHFKKLFDRVNRSLAKNQFLTYYFIAAHPGCTSHDMKELSRFARTHLKLTPEQVQIFTPTPSTYSTLMYFTGEDPFSKESIFTEKDIKGKEQQKKIITPPGKSFSR